MFEKNRALDPKIFHTLDPYPHELDADTKPWYLYTQCSRSDVITVPYLITDPYPQNENQPFWLRILLLTLDGKKVVHLIYTVPVWKQKWESEKGEDTDPWVK